MVLSFRFLNDVNSVNSFESAASASISAGDTQDLYIMLVDSSLDRTDQGFNPAGRRYMPPATTSLTCTFTNAGTGPSTPQSGFDLGYRLNPTVPVNFVRTATQPFAGDASIWMIPLLASDPLNGTINMKLIMTEPTRVLTAAMRPGLVLRAY